jgi:transcriptional regulator GlxA family with amidase domain
MPLLIVFAIEDALASSIALPLEMLRAADQHQRAQRLAAEPLSIRVVAESRRSVRMSGALRLMPDAIANSVDQADLVIVPSLWRTPAAIVRRHPRIGAALTRLATNGARLCGIGTGSYFLASAGLLDGRPATTHWSFLEDFGQRFPQVQLQRRHLITRSGPFYCAGSVNSSADLTVHLIAELFGTAAARQVESQFSPEIRRPFAASSFVQGESGAHGDELIWMAQDWMLAHLTEPPKVADVAAHFGLSERSFSRRFRAAVGTSASRFLQNAKLNTARDLLRQSNASIGDIALRCGYGDISHFSRAFRAHVGASPQLYRQQVRGKLFTA